MTRTIKLLAKAGILNVKQEELQHHHLSLTPAGEKLLGEISGVEKGKNPDGNITYTVPLAERQIVKHRQGHHD